MQQTAKLTVGLGLTCLLAAAVLAVANIVTEAPRKRAEALERSRNLQAILPGFANDPVAESRSFSLPEAGAAGTVTFYPAREGGAQGPLVAIAGEAVSGRGFGGDLRILAGLRPDGTLLAVCVTSHAETPGLGTKVTDRARVRYIWQAFAAETETGMPPSEFLDQFSGRNLTALPAAGFALVPKGTEAGDGGVHAVTGATVSSRAVLDAVNHIVAAFTAHREEIVGW